LDESTRQKWIDRVIREAQGKGLFENLEGEGRPINWEDESLVDQDWLMAFRIMREHGYAPEWIELHKEIGEELKRAREAILQAWLWRRERLERSGEMDRRYIEVEWRRARAGFSDAITELNAKITDFNLLVPITGLQKFKLNFAEELAALGIDG
jgi:hypothetical protein